MIGVGSSRNDARKNIEVLLPFNNRGFVNKKVVSLRILPYSSRNSSKILEN